jgi:cytochrome c oxidase subunit 2
LLLASAFSLTLFAWGCGSEPPAAEPEPERAARPVSPEVARGRQLFESTGCDVCHSVNGKRMLGPTVKGLYGKQRPLSDGTEVLADDAYLRSSIVDPYSQLVKGYGESMPDYEGVLDDGEIDAINAYIKSLE